MIHTEMVATALNISCVGLHGVNASSIRAPGDSVRRGGSSGGHGDTEGKGGEDGFGDGEQHRGKRE